MRDGIVKEKKNMQEDQERKYDEENNEMYIIHNTLCEYRPQ